MTGIFGRLVEGLRNPEQASSFLPLLIVVSVFTLVSTGTIYLILKMLRPPLTGAGASRFSKFHPVLLFLRTGERLRAFVKWQMATSDDRHRQSLAQVEELREKCKLLEAENLELRELHAKSLHRVAELNDEVKASEAKKDEAVKQVQARADDLENQIREIMKEIDGMYDENVKALNAANESRVQAQKRAEEIEKQLATLMASKPPVPSPSADSFAVAEENRKLKELLKVCREQILAITKAHKAAKLKKAG